jgi:hypothetical protein
MTSAPLEYGQRRVAVIGPGAASAWRSTGAASAWSGSASGGYW